MRNRSRIVGKFFRRASGPALKTALGAVIGASALTGAALAGTAAGPAAAGASASAGSSVNSTVTIEITDLRSAKGVVRACMTTDPGKFPKCRGVAGAHSAVVPAGETARLTFTGVKPGRYAIALLHDENDNGKADRALTMIPREGFGFSRDAKVRMGPPTFDSAAFDVQAKPISQKIRMRYML